MLAANSNRVRGLRILLDVGADPSMRDQNGYIALQMCSVSNASEAAEVLANWDERGACAAAARACPNDR